MAVRHPLDRIVSAWAFFCADDGRQVDRQPGLKSIGYYHSMPFDEFLDICLDRHNENAHTRKQSVFAGPHEIDWLCRLADLPVRWERLRGMFTKIKEIHVSHRSEHDKWETYYSKEQRARAESEFSDDVALFERAE